MNTKDKDKTTEPEKQRTAKSLIPPLPEDQARIRINKLHGDIRDTEREIKTLEGKLVNSNPKEMANIQAENNVFQHRIEKLEVALFGLLAESFLGRETDDIKLKDEVLRQAAVEYFKIAKIKNEIWKSIES